MHVGVYLQVSVPLPKPAGSLPSTKVVKPSAEDSAVVVKPRVVASIGRPPISLVVKPVHQLVALQVRNALS